MEGVMIVDCPHCGKRLKMSGKFQGSIRKLGPGKKIKITCIQCSNSFGLETDRLIFEERKAGGKKQRDLAGNIVQPPDAPDLLWLKDGIFEETDVVEDIPQSLVLMPDVPERKVVIEAVEKFGYRVEMADTPDQAINKMQFVNFASVFLHSGYEPGGIESGIFHQYMRNLKMARRRLIIYVLIGPEFKTLYNLQALASSANLVVNDAEIPYIETVLRKTIPEYEALFGPLIEELRIAGKE